MDKIKCIAKIVKSIFHKIQRAGLSGMKSWREKGIKKNHKLSKYESTNGDIFKESKRRTI